MLEIKEQLELMLWVLEECFVRILIFLLKYFLHILLFFMKILGYRL